MAQLYAIDDNFYIGSSSTNMDDNDVFEESENISRNASAPAGM